jgi:glycosyltransferase involved in cell wall biosynthesis
LKLLFLTTEDTTFCTHRLALARAAKRKGADVVIMIRPGAHYERLQQEGFRLIPWNIWRKSLNPIREIRSLVEVVEAYRRERPDLVHHVALKPMVYGSLASRLSRGIPAVNSLTGLGPIFTTRTFLHRILRVLLARLLRFSLVPQNSLLITQNEDDRDLLCNMGVASAHKTSVVFGFGVDTDHFSAIHQDEAKPAVVVLPARMLWEKGIREFVEAAAELRARAVPVRMALVGSPDEHNPGCIPEVQLRRWSDSGVVEWWGYCHDMRELLSLSQVVCLPSYREGLPRVLIEAASCGKAIVATNVPGCSAVVKHGVNGLLVPSRDSKALADALEVLIHDGNLRAAMGAAGRRLALEKFSERNILPRIMHTYNEALAGKWEFNLQSFNEELKFAVGR